ncbi:E3 ubiquitin-protein ligase TRIM71-like [Mytilus californianus]|uniref:E3 ubiquitin-protein ligase TRIM71-like n=1 Tax=Mytilus californianus TaxID=6549 RepID=UPI002246BF1A|nr:E3 ubiquitin-protein ligase TRIM71-like [Mytilus californianus]
MMASNSSHCESCSEEGKSIGASQFCSDCDERLCKECVEYHKKCKATKSHHLMDLASMLRSKIPNVKKFCEVHEGVSLDFYCMQHDTVCCRKCIPSKHQSCKDVLPLEDASQHIKKSSVFDDTFREWQNIAKTLDHLRNDRNDNINELEKSESAICEEVNNLKNHLIKQINSLVEKLKIDLSNCKKKNLDQLRKESSEISELHDNVQEMGQELEFLMEHGSNNQLYLKLREQGKGVQDVVKRVQEMAMSYKRVYLKFEKRADIDLKSMGSISECKEACDVLYSSAKLQQAQVQPEKVEPILTLKKESSTMLNLLDKLRISDLAVTADKTVFLCNNHHGVRKVYVYKTNVNDLTFNTTLRFPSEPYGISILTGTEKAVVTIPLMSVVQFINTKRLSLDETIQVGTGCFGIGTSEGYIAVGSSTEIRIFKQNGINIKTIALKDIFKSIYVRSINYDHNDGSIIYRKPGLINRIQFDGSVLYRYEVLGAAGLAVDTQGHVYVSDQNKSEIQRLLPDGRFRDVVLTTNVKKPFAIAFNASFTNFYVTNLEGLLQIYNCN